MKRFLWLLLLFLPSLCHGQSYELLCPSGSAPLYPTGVTYNGTTGKYRQWMCFDSQGNVTQTVSGSTAGVSATIQFNNAVVNNPSPLATTACPPGKGVLQWLFDTTNNNWGDYAYISTQTNPPAGMIGSLTFCRRVWLNDSGSDSLSGTAFIKNSLFSIYHIVGNQQNTGSSFADRAMGFRTETGNFPGTPSNGNPTIGNILGVYAELGLGGTPVMSPSGSEDAAAVARYTFDDQHVAGVVTPLTGVTGSYLRNSSGTVSGCSLCLFGVRGVSNDNTAGNPTSGTGFAGVSGTASQNGGNANGIGYGVYGGASNWGQANYSIYGASPGAGGSGLQRNKWSGYFEGPAKDDASIGVEGALVLRSGSSGGSGHASIRTARAGAGAPGNTDPVIRCTMVAGVCPTYTFTETYGQKPVCTATWTGTGTLTGLIKTLTTTTNVAPTSTVNTDTAEIDVHCWGLN